jgi:glycosyltransferase involved in cell wall biosynthesis
MAHAPLHLLCVEPRFPGRLGSTADWLVRRRGYRCRFFCSAIDQRGFWPESVGQGLEVIQFKVGGVARGQAAAWTRVLERGLCYAYGFWEALAQRRPFPVDAILGRSCGLGSTLYAPVYQPGIPIVNLFDYYVPPRTLDLADEDVAALLPSYVHWRRSANVMDLLDLENGVSPWIATAWQRDLYPPEYRADFLVLFDGIDARRFRRPANRPRVVAGKTIPLGAKVVTFVASSSDRLRGFDRYLNLLNRLVKSGEDVIGIAIGAPAVTHGIDVRFFNQDFRAIAMGADPPPDPARLWLLDHAAQPLVSEVLAASDLHVYASRPYCVSRSLVEAMAAGCVILAWDSPAVREFITPNQTGLVVPPDDPDEAERLAREALRNFESHQPLGLAAAERARSCYAQDVTLPALASHFDRLRTGMR